MPFTFADPGFVAALGTPVGWAGQKTATASGTSITVDAPSSIAEGDLLVCFVASTDSGEADSIFATPPTGWTELIAEHETAYPTVPGVSVFTKRAGASEPTDYTWSGGYSTDHRAVIGRVVQAGTVDGVSGANSSATDVATLDLPAVDAVGESLLLAVWGLRSSSQPSADPAMTVIVEASGTPGTAAGWEDVGDGSTGTRTGGTADRRAAGAMLVVSFTGGWDVTTATYVASFDASTEQTDVLSVAMKPDGTRLFVAGSTPDEVHQYDLGTPWDVTTATLNGSFDTSVVRTSSNPRGVRFSPDGTRMYLAEANANLIDQYDLSTPWDVTTAVLDAGFPVDLEETTVRTVALSADGTRMFIAGSDSNSVHQYDLSAPWDVLTASYSGSYSLTDLGGAIPAGLSFNPVGTRMFVASSSFIYVYDLAVAWDATTAAYDTAHDFSAVTTAMKDVVFDRTGTRLISCDTVTSEVHQFDLAS